MSLPNLGNPLLSGAFFDEIGNYPNNNVSDWTTTSNVWPGSLSFGKKNYINYNSE